MSRMRWKGATVTLFSVQWLSAAIDKCKSYFSKKELMVDLLKVSHGEKEIFHKLQKIFRLQASSMTRILELPSLTAGATFKKSTRKLPWDSEKRRHCVSCR